ncbi:MAG: helix-turn-helix transcriptional regulator [Ferruginibacter sp.]
MKTDHPYFPAKNNLERLSKSELKVLELVSQGLTSAEIGKLLTIACSTVQTHRRNMLRKTNFSNSQQLVACAVREGWLK